MEINNQKIENLRHERDCAEDLEYIDCTFYKCLFSDTKLKSCSFDNCEFIDCTLRTVTFQFCSMRNCAFTGCGLFGINWSDLQGRSSTISSARFMKKCVIKYNSFIKLKLIKFDFSGSTIQDTYFQDCILTKANFQNVDFQKPTFQNCDLKEADFRDAHNYSIDILNNKLKGAKFSYPDVVNLLSTLDIVIG